MLEVVGINVNHFGKVPCVIFHIVTRMHSSRMRTGRSLTVCCSLVPGGVCLFRGVSGWSGGGLLGGGGGGVSAWSGGVCLLQGGLPAPGVCLVWGGLPGPGGSALVCLPGGSAWSQGGLPGLGGFSLPEGGLPGDPPCEQNHRHM